jgi:hypothetical protein
VKTCNECGVRKATTRLPTNGHMVCSPCFAARVFPNHSGVDREASDYLPDIHRYDESTEVLVPTGERTVGVEIEGAWSVGAANALWGMPTTGIKKDGSLRGADSFEVVSPILKSSNYQIWLDKIPWDGLDLYSRAGIHVWFGTRDKNWTAINKLLFYCATHEREFSSIVSPTRKLLPKRDYTGKPMKITWIPAIYSTKNGFLRSLYGLSGNDLLHERGLSRMQFSKRANDREGHKYPGPINRTWWFNVHPHFGTRKAIEIRLLHTTNVKEVVEAWVELWLSLIDSVCDMSINDLRSTGVAELAPRKCRLVIEAAKANAGIVPDGKSYQITTRNALRGRVDRWVKEGGI